MHHHCMSRKRALVSVLLAGFVCCGSCDTITTTATFNNIGIVIDLSTPASQGTVRVFLKNSRAPTNEYREAHSLCQLTATRFAGSVFGLKPGTGYDLKFSSPVFPGVPFVPVSTRPDAFPEAANTVYHVSPVTGNDTNNGSSAASPFRTLAKALSAATAGTKILLYDGTYYEGDLSPPRSGTATSPVVIENAPGNHPVLNGLDRSFSATWALHDAATHLYRTPCTAIPKNAYLNGGQFFHYPDLSTLSNSPWAQPGGYFADGTYLYARFPENGAPGTNVLSIPARTTALTLDQKSNLQIRGIEFCYYGLNDFHRAIYIYRGSSNVVDRCYFHHNGIGVALKYAAHFNTIQNCVFTEFPISTWSWHAVKDSGRDYEAGGVVVYGSGETNSGNVIRSCTFTNMFDGAHLFSDNVSGPTENMDFHNNVIEHCVDDGIETDGAGSNCRIYFNQFRDFLTGVSVAPAAPGPTYIFRNVLSDWRNSEEFAGYPYKFNVGSSIPIEWVHLYHNTCCTTVPGQNGFWLKQYSNWRNVVSRNNIYCGTAYGLEKDASTANTEDLDYDCVFTTKAPPVIRWSGVNYNSLVQFSQAVGLEIHGVTNQPAFLNPGLHDYYLPAGSPPIDKGVPIPGVNDDWVGSAPDLGALEYGMLAERISVGVNGVDVDWRVGAFGKYQLESAPNLAPSGWTSFGPPVQAQGPWLQMSVPATADGQRFFRLRHVAL